jgi:NADPH2:quinone reductase
MEDLMKALSYIHSHPISKFAIELKELPRPVIKPTDILVSIRAIAINPVDYKIRQSRSGSETNPVILGWDAAGVVEEVGADVKGFKVGEEVYYAGDLSRPGAYAEKQAVDYRLVGKKPKSLSFAEAAALPLTTLTAWESLFDRPHVTFDSHTKVLIIGGAGGVGSLAIQLLKAKTSAKVIASASRPESIAWVKKMGADHVIDHSKDLKEGLKAEGIDEVDLVFGTTHSDLYLKTIPDLLRPFGHFLLIDDPASLDIVSFKRKALSVHWELMFTKSLFGHRLESQGQILNEMAMLIDSGKVKTTVNTVLKGMTVASIQEAHKIQESGKALGKTVIEY